MRLNATEIDSKSADGRTLVTASARATSIHHIVRSRGQHRIHHVILKPERIAEIELQTLAEESSHSGCVIELA